jgi:hypothetical protein
MANKISLIGLPAIPSLPGQELDIKIGVDNSKAGSPGIEVDQTRGPRVLIENQKGCMVVYVWKSAKDKDYGSEPIKINCACADRKR